MSAPAVVKELIERFDAHKETYQSGQYNEAQLREEFLNPFFEALGWDLFNRKGYADAYKEVIHEDAIKIGGRTKAPDYCFRAGGGQRSFFVEAKKPSVDIGDAISPAYQLRRYAWSAKLPVSILTDFEEFAVYDCRIRPDKDDKASTARVIYLNYSEYVERWDELYGLFSPEAIRKGSLEKFVTSKRVKKGTAEVDKAFLDEIEGWRTELARHLALRNEGLSPRDLNFSVQRIIDRIIFLRICEDRGIEPYGKLESLQNAPNIYRRMRELFQRADDRYNSGLFHFTPEKDRSEPPDELTLDLTVDDKPLMDILGGLYYPESPYEFSVFPVEILGQVYEQFLGKVIRLTKGHQAKVEEKPEVRKAGGVYYTPSYIVDYIVRHTVGKLLNGESDETLDPDANARSKSKAKMTPTQAAKLRILDPACGSGSFLLGAYQYLLDWHRDWYVADGEEKHAKGRSPKLYRGRTGEWRLTSAERKRMLLNNIYGVDIDEQAVEVTKLSLLLKVLEGESGETIDNQIRLFHQRALPDLGDNIKCGNSLIGPDFYNGHQLSLFDEEERFKINVFDWCENKVGFGKIISAAGFDAVIGNPPYIRMESFKDIKSYLKEHYESYDERSDLYVYFIEKEHDLLRNGGKFGMIVSNKFLRANYGKKIRSYLAKTANIDRILDMAGLRVFGKPTVRTIVLLTSKGTPKTNTKYSPPPAKDIFIEIQSGNISLADATNQLVYEVPAVYLRSDIWNLLGSQYESVLKKMARDAIDLSIFIGRKICRGIVSGLTEAFVISKKQYKELIRNDKQAQSLIYPFIQGRNIRRYQIEPSDEYLIYTYHGVKIQLNSPIIKHLLPYKAKLQDRATKQRWYELQQPQYRFLEYMNKPKIIFPDIATGCRFMLDHEGYFGANTVYFLPTDDLRLLGLLNSNLALFYFKQKCAALEGSGESYLRFFGQYMDSFPVKLPHSLKDKHNLKMITLVETMLELHKSVARARSGHEKTVFERHIAFTDRQIDQLVYELYGLTDEEIAIVEENA